MTDLTQQKSNIAHYVGNIRYSITLTNGKSTVTFSQDFIVNRIDSIQNQIDGLTRQQMFWRKLLSTPTGERSPDVGGNVDGFGPSGHASEKDVEGGIVDAGAQDDEDDEVDFSVKVATDAAVDEAEEAAVDADEEDEFAEESLDDDEMKTTPDLMKIGEQVADRGSSRSKGELVQIMKMQS